MTVVYVSPEGSDGSPGTNPAAPPSLTRALRAYRSDTEIRIADGDYRVSALTSGGGMKLIGQGDRVTLRAANAMLLQPGEAHGLVLERLTFADCPSYSVRIFYSSGVRVRNCKFIRCNTGLIFNKCRDFLVEGTSFTQVGIPEKYGAGDGIYVAGGVGGRITRCRFHKCGHYAITVAKDKEVLSERITIDSNIIDQYWGGGVGLALGSNRCLVKGNEIRRTGVEMEYTKAAIQISASNNIVESNIIEELGRKNYAFELTAFPFGGYEQHCENNVIRNNTSRNNGGITFFISPRRACRAADNTIEGNLVENDALNVEPPVYVYFETYHSADKPPFPGGNQFMGNRFRSKRGKALIGTDALTKSASYHEFGELQKKFPDYFRDNTYLKA
ncbi:MAG: right-handed parallel beta-helix repeat-containing protein [Acidobacteria bacterium]|nr:right-handed parallel beta-helix repeat-containing protein [Acidobacteriota bacterium]